MVRYICSLLLVFLVLAKCNITNTKPLLDQKADNEGKAVLPQHPSRTITPEIFSQETPTAKLSYTVTTNPDRIDDLTSSCPEAMAIDQLDSNLPGGMVIWDKGNLAVMDIKTANRVDVRLKTEGTVSRNVSMSPDGKWLVYSKDGVSSISLLSGFTVINHQVIGDIEKEIPLHWEKGFYIQGWLDNEHITLIRYRKPFHSTVVINPFTLDQAAFLLDEFEDFPRVMGASELYFISSNLMPDPTLGRVAYPKSTDGHFYISLWDRYAKKEIVKVEDQYGYQHDPLWANDGKDFLIAVATQWIPGKDMASHNLVYNWFQVTQAGSVKQLTHFENSFSYAEIGNASRSRDGRYLAYQLQYMVDSQRISKWLMMDLQSHVMLDYCIPGKNFPGWPLPIWSPDNHYLIISTPDSSDQGPVFLIDVQKGKIYRVADDIFPIGWMRYP